MDSTSSPMGICAKMLNCPLNPLPLDVADTLCVSKLRRSKTVARAGDLVLR